MCPYYHRLPENTCYLYLLPRIDIMYVSVCLLMYVSVCLLMYVSVCLLMYVSVCLLIVFHFLLVDI